jgi:hypothetical protein
MKNLKSYHKLHKIFEKHVWNMTESLKCTALIIKSLAASNVALVVIKAVLKIFLYGRCLVFDEMH